MKRFAILFISCLAVFGADDDVRMFTRTQHLDWGATHIKETYVRGAETNLICCMLIAPKEPFARYYTFHHGGECLGAFVTGTNDSGCITLPSPQYMLAFACGPSNELRAVIVGNKKGEVVDAFGCTNGVISPIGNSLLREAKWVNMLQYLHPDGIRRSVWNEPSSGHK